MAVSEINTNTNTKVQRILAFDIGIKNLAWCAMEKKGVQTGSAVVHGWANENILADATQEEVVAANRCHSCAHKATYWKSIPAANSETTPAVRGYCVRHCPPLTPALRDASGVLLKKIPKLPVLKALAVTAGATKAQTKTKAAMVDFLGTKYAMPIRPGALAAGEQKAKGADLEKLHDGMRAMIARNLPVFRSCTLIILENQPVLKNPVMKSVQMMLFASLRDALQPNPPPIKLVHAGKKTKDAATAIGDEGYSDRKSASEARVADCLSKRSVVMGDGVHGGDGGWFAAQKKRSDLADCFCMCLDALAGV